MKAGYQLQTEELAAFAAMLDTLTGCRADKLKVAVIVGALQNTPGLVKHLHAACDPTRQYRLHSRETRGIMPNGTGRGVMMFALLREMECGQVGRGLAAANWRALLNTLAPTLRRAANAILNKSHKLNPSLVNQALVRYGGKQIPVLTPLPAPRAIRKMYEEGDYGLLIIGKGNPLLLNARCQYWPLDELKELLIDYTGPPVVLDGAVLDCDCFLAWSAQPMAERISTPKRQRKAVRPFALEFPCIWQYKGIK